MDEDELYRDHSLQMKSARGDEQAFKLLFDRYHGRLFQYIFSIVKSQEVSEELVMDVFLKLWQAKEMLPEIKNMESFLFRIAYNKSIDFFRAVSKDKRFTALLWDKIQTRSTSNADDPLLLQEYETKVRQAINLLPAQRRKIFNLSQEEGLTNTQIAEELGISKNTVANTLVEARQFIKTYLAKNLDLVVLMTVLSSFLKNK